MGIATCSGGTGSPNVGLDLAATYGAGRLAQLLVGAGISELSAWLPLVGLIPVVYSAFCAADPPTMVALTQAESDAIANKTFDGDFFSGLGKFKDIILNLIWHDACQCTGGAEVVTAPPAINANTPVYQFPAPQLNAPCFDSPPFSHSLISSGGFIIGGLNTTATPGLQPTAYVCLLTSTVTTGPGTTLPIRCAPNSSAAVTISLPPGTSRTLVCPISYPTDTLTVLHADPATAGSGAEIITTQEQWYCGTYPLGEQSPCCPPDPATLATLEAILATVSLIQRQAVPFAYLTGAVHAGLSGAGALSLSGLLGVKVAITALPASYGSEGSSPPEHFDLGFVTFGTADGFPSAFRLTRNPQVMMPARCSVYTDLDYDLSPGVVVTITELVREA